MISIDELQKRVKEGLIKLPPKVELIDLYYFLNKDIHDSQWVITLNITCIRCNSSYKKLVLRPKSDYDNKPYYWNTYHCPQCPEESLEEWLKTIS